MRGNLEFAGLGQSELPAALSARMTQFRVLYAEMLDLIAELSHRHTAAQAGYPSLARYLCDLLRIAPNKATVMVVQAEQVAESVTPTGHVAPAPLPRVRHALHDGAVDADHVQAIAETVRELPTWATVEHRDLVESTLTDTARVHDARVVRQQGRILLARIDQDGHDPHQEERLAEPANTFHYRQQRSGMLAFHGTVDAEAGEELINLLAPLATPQPAADGVPDPRSPDRRLGDAFAQVVHRAATDVDADTMGGLGPVLNVHLNMDTLRHGVGIATLDGGAFLPATAVRRAGCDADLIPIVLGTDSVPLDVGRKHRLVTPHQRKALIARDKGCAFPGCPLPPRWTEAHHIHHWSNGGPSNLANLVLLCRRHHRLAHHSAWTIQTIDGLPHFRPPHWLDPHQKPRRNILRQ